MAKTMILQTFYSTVFHHYQLDKTSRMLSSFISMMVPLKIIRSGGKEKSSSDDNADNDPFP